MTLDIGVLEEAAHIGVAVFQKVLLPLCGVNNFVIIGISTPQDESNYYSRLLDLKDHDGRPFFVALRIEQACAKCIQNNKAASCEHMQHLLPPWKSAERSRKMAAVYSNDVNSFVQENQGVVLNSSKTYIFRDYIKTFLANPPYIFDKRPSVIFVAIDPSGGGSQSQYACVALAIEGQYNVIVGADSCGSHSSVKVTEFLDHFVGSLRTHPLYSSALMIFAIESNLSYLDSDRVRILVTQDKYQPSISIDKDPKKLGRAGVFTTESCKRVWADDLGNLLRTNTLRMAQDRIERFDAESKVDPCSTLVDQLRVYRRELKVPTDPAWSAARVTFTGKQPGVQDDLAVALQLAVTQARIQRADSEFVRLARSQGWDLL